MLKTRRTGRRSLLLRGAAIPLLLLLPVMAAGRDAHPSGSGLPPEPAQSEISRALLDRRAEVRRQVVQAPPATVTDIGDVAVIEDDGTMMVAGLIVWERVVQEFYRTHVDSFDILAIYTASTYPTNIEPGFNATAFEFTVRNDIAGIGRLVGTDENATIGIDTQRLKAVTVMNDLDDYGPAPTDTLPTSIVTGVTGVELLGHEAAHLMSAYVNIDSIVPGASLLGGAVGHWSYLVDGEGSVLYSPRWQDNLDGTFTVLEIWNHYSRLDQYLWGMRPAADVGPRFLIVSADSLPVPFPAGYTVTGTRIDFTIADVIAQNGPRVPDAASAQHDFRIAFALHVPWGTSASAGDLAFLEELRTAWADWFHEETDSVGTMDGTLAPTPVAADLTADVTAGNAPLTVRFRDLSWGAITSRTWDFGDGSPTSSQTNPVHTYAEDGVYTVTLTVDGAGGPAAAVESGLVTVGGFATVFFDDFETDLGWTVGAPDDAVTGNWERGDPEGTSRAGYPLQPEDDFSAAGTHAWVTGLAAGSGATSFDVDGGTTTLYSPVLDLSATSDPLVSYARWFSNNVGTNPAEDPLVVEISGDGGGTWTLLESVNVSSTVDYHRVQFRIADFIVPTATVAFRFQAADPVFPSLVEASIDDFAILDAAPVTADWAGAGVPDGVRLEWALPNPFRASTTIHYALPAPLEAAIVVFDAAGRRVRTLVRGHGHAGRHAVVWDGRDDAGRPVAAGVYWVRLRAGDTVRTRTAVLLR